jgi:cell division protein FtsN
VQVAAYATRADAEALAAKLAARGYTARVSGAAAPFRVQVGPYATREAAAAGLERVRAAKLNGFVVATDGR